MNDEDVNMLRLAALQSVARKAAAKLASGNMEADHRGPVSTTRSQVVSGESSIRLRRGESYLEVLTIMFIRQYLMCLFVELTLCFTFSNKLS